jgi:hypothetical protein
MFTRGEKKKKLSNLERKKGCFFAAYTGEAGLPDFY